MPKFEPLNYADSIDDHMYLACPRAEQMLREVEGNTTLVQELSTLDLRTRRVLDMRYAEELTTRETGERLGISHVMVQKIERSALDKLRLVLAG